MVFKILLSRRVQTPNSNKKLANLLPIANVCLQHKSTFGVHYRTGSPGQPGLRVAGFPGHWVAGSQNVTKFHVWYRLNSTTRTRADPRGLFRETRAADPGLRANFVWSGPVDPGRASVVEFSYIDRAPHAMRAVPVNAAFCGRRRVR